MFGAVKRERRVYTTCMLSAVQSADVSPPLTLFLLLQPAPPPPHSHYIALAVQACVRTKYIAYILKKKEKEKNETFPQKERNVPVMPLFRQFAMFV